MLDNLDGGREPYQTFVDKGILKPLGMHHSYFDTTPPFLLPHRSHSYVVGNGLCDRTCTFLDVILVLLVYSVDASNAVTISPPPPCRQL